MLYCYCDLTVISQERVQADLQTERFRDGDHLGDEGVHLGGGFSVHVDGAHHTLHLRSLVR